MHCRSNIFGHKVLMGLVHGSWSLPWLALQFLPCSWARALSTPSFSNRPLSYIIYITKVRLSSRSLMHQTLRLIFRLSHHSGCRGKICILILSSLQQLSPASWVASICLPSTGYLRFSVTWEFWHWIQFCDWHVIDSWVSRYCIDRDLFFKHWLELSHQALIHLFF